MTVVKAFKDIRLVVVANLTSIGLPSVAALIDTTWISPVVKWAVILSAWMDPLVSKSPTTIETSRGDQT